MLELRDWQIPFKGVQCSIKQLWKQASISVLMLALHEESNVGLDSINHNLLWVPLSYLAHTHAHMQLKIWDEAVCVLWEWGKSNEGEGNIAGLLAEHREKRSVTFHTWQTSTPVYASQPKIVKSHVKNLLAAPNASCTIHFVLDTQFCETHHSSLRVYLKMSASYTVYCS